MAHVHTVGQNFNFLFFSTIILCFSTILVCANEKVEELDESNWRNILEGEWMVEFHAPWCPACTALAPAWRELAARGQKLSLRTGAVDVTKSPGLSGRFVVTALPTIFHVKDSEFRQYKGPRDVDTMLEFVTEKRWKQTEPVSAWKAPHSLQMTLVAEFFKLSQALRGIHNDLMEVYGLPTWGSYLIFAIATIFVGALLGLILVCVIDLLYPPKRGDKVFIKESEVEKQAKGDEGKEKNDDDQELLNDDIVDDNEENSDAEKHSPSDSSEEEKSEQSATGAGEGGAGTGDVTEVRRRRARKAD